MLKIVQKLGQTLNLPDFQILFWKNSKIFPFFNYAAFPKPILVFRLSLNIKSWTSHELELTGTSCGKVVNTSRKYGLNKSKPNCDKIVEKYCSNEIFVKNIKKFYKTCEQGINMPWTSHKQSITSNKEFLNKSLTSCEKIVNNL